MSASDALAAIQVIHTVVGKVSIPRAAWVDLLLTDCAIGQG